MVYIGDLKKLYVKDLTVTEEGVKVVLDSTLIEKDSLFYRNFVGKLINFKHNTNLPTYGEAASFLNDSMSAYQEKGYASCLYADYDTVRPAVDEGRSVKQLKKEFREERKRRAR